MTYQAVLEWLQSRSTLDFDKGGERVQWLLENLGSPQLAYPTVHVVGTNGKGSTVNALAAIFQAAGYRVGRFTSPSILDFREQIVYQGEMISEEDLIGVVADIKPLVERLPLETNLSAASEFEVLVVAMFWYFARYAQPDLVLVEAGLGGLADATNVLSPLVVICPSIGLDHQEFLGQTYGAIAAQKVGVLRPGVPLLYASRQPEVVQVFEEHARSLGSPCLALGREIVLGEGRAGLSVQTPLGSLEGITLQMMGQHQRENAALAVAAALLLREGFPALSPATIRSGLSVAVWPGRQEMMSPCLMIDGAHNQESIAALVATLRERYGEREVQFLFAAIRTKPVGAMLEQLSQLGPVTVTSFADARALPIESYPASYPSVEHFQDWLDQVALDDPGKLYVVTGSLYFITFVRKYLLDSWEDGKTVDTDWL